MDDRQEELQGGFYRTGFQVMILMLCTIGLYVVYWLIRTRIAANRRLQRANEIWPFWLMLLVPVVFLYPIFSTYILLQRSVRLRLPHALLPIPFVVLGLFHLMTQSASRLYDVVGLWGFLAFIPIAVMQQYAIEADVAGGPIPRKAFAFSWIEWVLVGVGAIALALFIVGTFTSDPGLAFSNTAALLVSVGATAVLWRFASTADRQVREPVIADEVAQPK